MDPTDCRTWDRRTRIAYARECAQFPAHLMPFAHNKDGYAVAWRSRDHLVVLHQDRGHPRLTVNRTAIGKDGWAEGISWDTLMTLKSQAGFGHLWAVEVCPPDTNVVNVANMRHLWLLPDAPEFAWMGGK